MKEESDLINRTKAFALVPGSNELAAIFVTIIKNPKGSEP